MKRTLALAILTISIVLSARADVEVFGAAEYTGTISRGGTNAPVVVQLFDNKTVTVRILHETGTIERVNGTWTEARFVRTVSAMNERQQFIATIRQGVVTGTWKDYKSGDTGTFRCDP